ncbi:endonuclease [Flavobacterium sp. SM15]|uniref:endonuclease n=1 Tax=Flavobacterium sp. SM15 TaxID=2908005 RepID=UPI001EDB9CF6|nr:endonuclease [Flavobacterium sp. SM15]MCG2611947.1 endonuclease [Flavobacterium sp. SM15]
MKKIYNLLFLFTFTLGLAQAGAPASPYYNGFNWTLTGTALKDALATKITTTHTKFLSYTPGVWEALKVVDTDPNNANNVLLVYGWENGTDADVTNDLSRSKSSNGGAVGDWNREHTYAQSVGTPDLGTSGAGSDAHHLRAADVQRNGTRGNRLFTTGTGNSGAVGAYWYPGDQWKGDIARMMMYMYLRYGSQCLPKNIGVGTIVSSDSNMIDLFLQWNAEDPVSQFEDNRNTYLGNTSNTYGQGNRNPFIDNPYLATRIWGGIAAENRWPTVFLSTTSFDALANVSVYPNPSNDHRININSEVELDEIQLININGQVIQYIKKPNRVQEVYTIENLPQGFYFVKLSTSDNQTSTKKILIN